MNVFTVNSPTGHSAWYVGRTHAYVQVCAYMCKGEVAFTPPDVYGNSIHGDDENFSIQPFRSCLNYFRYVSVTLQQCLILDV